MTTTLTASQPAKNDTAIVFAADGAYEKFALFAAEQISKFHPKRNFDICLCAMGEQVPIPPSLAHLDIRYCRIATGDLFDGLRLDEGRTQVVYLRLALPLALKSDYRRILYLDSDIFVQGGDFAALLDVDLGGRILGAVRDNMQWRTPGRRPLQFRRLGLPAVPYFNAGVLLIDVARYIDADLMGRCVAFGRRNREKMIRHDQNLLNGTLQGDWAELNPTWNWQYTRSSMLFEAMEGAHVVHFIGPKKPWKHTSGALPLRFRRAYRDFFAAHFPDAAPIGADGMPPHQNQAYLRGIFWRHLMAAGRFGAYLDRFDNDLTVL
ncbi:MAG: glycosyltransferase family 8 protein [Pseudomonadota bacterium]